MILGHLSAICPFCISSYCSTINWRISFLYGRDSQLPTEAALCPPTEKSTICLDDYKTEVLEKMSTAWQLAQDIIRKSQSKQKAVHDRKASDTRVKLGDKVLCTCQLPRLGQLTS